MTKLPAGGHPTVNPIKHNQTRPHHGIARMMHPRYVHEHALISRYPPAAQLPSEITPPATLAQDLVLLLDPPEEHWNRSSEHEAKRRHLRQNHNKVFRHVLENAEALCHLLYDVGAICGEDRDNMLAWHQETCEAFSADDAVAYIQMPQWLLHYYDLLRLVQQYLSDEKFAHAEQRFCLVLLYPHDDWSSYGLNLTYRWHLPDPANNLCHYSVLCGYRLGRSKLHQGQNRTRSAIYLEDDVKITTLYSGFQTSLLDFSRTGLISRITPEKYG